MVRRVELEAISLPYKFDVSKVSKREARVIGLGRNEFFEEFYSNPENERKFQEWLKKQNI